VKKFAKIEDSPFKKNRLKPVIFYNREGNMEMCYLTNKSLLQKQQDKHFEAEQREIEKKLEEKSDIHVCEDENPKDLIGERAIIRYQDAYKNLDKILAENKSYGVKNSLITDMLSKLQDNHLLPIKMGVIKLKGKNTEINLKYFLEIHDFFIG